LLNKVIQRSETCEIGGGVLLLKLITCLQF